MGRVTEFINYINSDHEPSAETKKWEYNYISFTEEITELAKAYRRKRKKEQRLKERKK